MSRLNQQGSPRDQLEDSLREARQLLAGRRSRAAAALFTEVYEAAGTDTAIAGQAMLGLARAELDLRQLDDAARHADTAARLLSDNAPNNAPGDARRVADLQAQIDHHRRRR